MLSSCQSRDEIRLSRDLEGAWAVDQIELIDWRGTGQDSLITPSSSVLFEFSSCREPREGCESTMELPDGKVQTYTYQLTAFDEAEVDDRINLSWENFDEDELVFPYYWDNTFEITEISESQMVWRGIQGGDLDELPSSEVVIRFSR